MIDTLELADRDLLASEHPAHHSADKAAGSGEVWTAAAAMTAATTTTAAAAASTGSRPIPGVITGAGLRRGDDFGQQRLMLQPVEEAGLGIATGGLPARDHSAR